MKIILLCAAVSLASYVTAEEQVTVTIFTMKDGRTLEAIRFASIGDEGARTFALKTMEGERLTVAEEDVASRSERRVPISGLSDKARAQLQHSTDVTAHTATREDSDAQNQKQIAAARKDVDARIAVRKLDDELAQAKARLIPIQQQITESTAAIAAAQANSDAAAKELGAMPDPRTGSMDAATREAENRREARREVLRKKIKAAEDEKARLTVTKTAAERLANDVSEQVKKLTEKRQAAQKDEAAAAVEKSKAIIAANAPDQATQKKTAETPKSSAIQTLKLKNGATLRVRSMQKLDDGALLVTDEAGQEHRIQASDVETTE